MRMLRKERHKLIYYPLGNRTQLFDVVSDPYECEDLAGHADSAETERELTALLIGELYGEDLEWVQDGRLVGIDGAATLRPDRALRGQRGIRFR